MEQDAGEEETEPLVHIVNGGAAKGEVGPSRVKRSNIEKLEEEFVEFKVEIESKFAVVR